MKLLVSALPKPACSHCRKLRAGGAPGCGGASVARSATMAATSSSGSRQTLAWIG